MNEVIKNQKEIERQAKLKALKNYELSDNYNSLVKEIEDRKERAKATVIVAYCTPQIETNEAGEQYSIPYTEVKKYNHKNKFAVGIEVMSEMMGLIDDSEGGKLIKEKIQDWIENSENHIGLWLVKFFPWSGWIVEYRYSDVEFTDSDLLLYRAQVASDTLTVIKWLIEEFSKQAWTIEWEEDTISEEIED